ncbi:MAG TPA: hypothetical protein PKD51_20095 [Saprospiraceae bacterium]|nr:hypothetical protein [Saprospiraceae bacterium]
MKYLSLLIMLTLIFLVNGLAAQTKWIAIQYDYKDSLYFIKPTGEIAFSLPYWIKPCYGTEEEFYIGEIYEIDFSMGIIPVIYEKNAYFIDTTGQKVKEINTPVHWASSYYHGFFKVHKQLDPKKNLMVNIKFYDALGDVAFGGKEFRHASFFEEGHAIVQEYNHKENWDNQSNPWQIINTKGEVVKDLSASMDGQGFYRLGSYEHGQWKLILKSFNYKYVDAHTFEMSDKKYTKSKKHQLIYNQLDSMRKAMNLRTKYELKYEKHSNIDKEHAFVIEANDDYGFLFIYDIKNNKLVKVLNPQGKEINLSNDENLIYSINNYMSTSKTVGDSNLHIVKDPITYNFFEKSEELPYAFGDGYSVFYRDNSYKFHSKVDKVINMNRQKIWPRTEEIIRFNTLKDALKSPENVVILELENITQKQWDSLPDLPKIKILQIKNSDIVEVSTWMNKHLFGLTTIYFENCKSLVRIYSKKIVSQTVVDIHINECPLLTNSIVDILRAFPQLKLIKSDLRHDIELPKKYPQIKFDRTLKDVGSRKISK